MAINLPIVSKFDDKGVNQATSSIDRLHGTVKAAGAAIIAAFSISVVTDFAGQLIRVGEESQSASRLLANAAKNAGVFGDSSKDIARATSAMEKHSEKLALVTGLDDELITQMKATWSAVPDLASMGADGLNNLAKVTADVAAGTGKDFESIGRAFIKIAGDEETAMGKLTRQGIVLSDSQKEVYSSLLNTSGEAAANAYLIEQLGIKYDGAAAASATASSRIGVAWENIQEQFATALLPAVEGFANWLVVNMPNIQKIINGFTDTLKWLGDTWDKHVTKPFEKFAKEHGPTFQKAWEENIKPAIDAMMPALQILGGILLWAADFAVKQLLDLLKQFGEWLADPNNKNTIMVFVGLIGGLAASFIAPWAIILTVIGVVALLLAKFQEFTDWLNNQGEWGKAIANIVNPIQGATSAINGLIDAIRILNSLTSQGNWSPQQKSNIKGMQSRGFGAPGTAKGGVTVGSGLQWVGEKGPELLTMPKGATVTPIPQHMRADAMFGANTARGGNSFSITVNAGMGADGASLGEEIVKQIRRYERTSGQVFASA